MNIYRTFEHWWDQSWGSYVESVPERIASVAWEAGVNSERERCARMVDHIMKAGGGTYGDVIRQGASAPQPNCS